MDVSKQNLKKKAYDKLQRMIAEASPDDGAPGLVKEASAAEREAFSSPARGSASSPKPPRGTDASSSSRLKATAQRKGKSQVSLDSIPPSAIRSALPDPKDSLSLSSRGLTPVSTESGPTVGIEDPVPSSPLSFTHPSMEGFGFSSSGQDLSAAEASPTLMQDLRVVSADPPSSSAKRKGSSPPSLLTKKGRYESGSMAPSSTSGAVVLSPLDSAVTAFSALNERDSQVQALSPLATFANINPYLPQREVQASQPRLSSSSTSSLAFIHSLRQKGLDVPPATTQGRGASVSFPGMVNAIDGGLAAMILDSIPREEDWRMAEAHPSDFLLKRAASLELQVSFSLFIFFFQIGKY